MGTVAAGDTLIYGFTWGPGLRATSYDVMYAVAATNGMWALAADSNGNGKFVPVAPLGPFPYSWNSCCAYQKAWFTAISWDSASFTVTVASRNSVGISAPVSTTWSVRRKPGAPGPITVDSIANLIVRPQGVTVGTAQTIQYCVFAVLKSGRRVKLQNSWNIPRCEQLYQQWLAEVPA